MQKITDSNEVRKMIRSEIKFSDPKTLKKFCVDEAVNSAHKRFLVLYGKDECLFSEGMPVKEVQFLLQGKVKVLTSNKGGKSRKLRTITAPDIVYLYSVLDEKVHSNSAVAVSEAYVCSIPLKEFKKILRNNTKLALGIMKLLCTNIKKIQNSIFSKRNN